MKFVSPSHPPARPLWQRFSALAQALCAALGVILFAAAGTAKAQSSACDMLTFSWSYSGTTYNGVFIDYGDVVGVEVTVPFGTNVSSVTPTITVSPGATVDPASGSVQNFNGSYDDPVLYTVTAQDGFTYKEYYVSFVFTAAAPYMLSMTFNGTAADIGPVNNNVSFVTHSVQSGPLTALTPIYTLSTGAWCDIPPNTTKDFTNAVEYTVYSADGYESTTYVVMVTVDEPIFVNAAPTGSGILTFTKTPSKSSWATTTVSGLAGDITSEAGMDAAMNNGITAAGINTTLASYTGTALNTAFWRLDRNKLGTQPTGNKMTLLKSTLKNTSGGILNGLAVSYELGATNTPAEQINGYRVYWSLSGNAGSWTPAGTHLRTSAGVTTIDFTIEFSQGWANQTDLYVVWADDNGSGTQGQFTIDQVSFTPIPPAANILTFNVAGVAANITGTEISLVAPPGVDTSNLTPDFTLSYGAQSNPPTGVAQNFSNPIVYTVTSAGGQITKQYTVTIASSYWAEGLAAEFFRFTTGYSALPDFTTLTPEVTRVDAQINYPSTNNAWAGLPANLTDNFGSRHTGAVRVDVAGNYTFYLTSDDGSKLWLNNALLINNDGLHGMQERSATVNLAVGYHPLRVEFFEAGGGAGMTLEWAGPGISRQLIPAQALYRLGSATRVTTTDLVSSLNPSLSGQSVTFTATLRYGGVVPTAPPAATGSYAFRRNGVVVAVAQLNNGVATYTTASLLQGSQTISATYSGDNNYRPSEASLTQINQVQVALTVNSGSGDGNYLSGATVPIVADTPAQGKAFAGWVVASGSPVIADASAPSTTVTLPATAVTVTATYRDVPPAGITPLAWYDASAASNSTTIQNGKVSEWLDKSGNGYHATQNNTTFRPTQEPGGIRFGGPDVHLILPVMAADAYTVMMVAKNDGVLTSSTGNQMPLSLQTYFAGPAFGSSGSAFRDEVVTMTDADVAANFTNRQAASNVNIPSVTAVPHLYSFVLTDNWHIGMDGSADLRNLTSGERKPMLFSQMPGAIGANARLKTTAASAVENEWVGLVSEIILVPTAITPAQRQNIEGYLAWKWDAINGNTVLRNALPAGHPYKNAAPATNTPPVAIAQNVAVTYATAKNITLGGSDAESNPLTYVIVSGPSNGVLSGSAQNRIYTPNFGFSGSDSFTFKVNDGQVDSATATVSITVADGDRYAQWLTLNGYSLTGGRLGDDDGDGLRNFDEFAFGLNPKSGASANPMLTPLNKATHTFSYTRYSHSNLAYTVWTSTDLAYWGENPVPVSEVVSAPNAKGVVTVQVTLTAPPVANNRLFLRVKAE